MHESDPLIREVLDAGPEVCAEVRCDRFFIPCYGGKRVRSNRRFLLEGAQIRARRISGQEAGKIDEKKNDSAAG